MLQRLKCCLMATTFFPLGLDTGSLVRYIFTIDKINMEVIISVIQVLDIKNAVLEEDELEHDLYAFGVQECHASIYPAIDAFMKKYNFTQVGICKVFKTVIHSLYVRSSYDIYNIPFARLNEL